MWEVLTSICTHQHYVPKENRQTAQNKITTRIIKVQINLLGTFSEKHLGSIRYINHFMNGLDSSGKTKFYDMYFSIYKYSCYRNTDNAFLNLHIGK